MKSNIFKKFEIRFFFSFIPRSIWCIWMYRIWDTLQRSYFLGLNVRLNLDSSLAIYVPSQGYISMKKLIMFVIIKRAQYWLVCGWKKRAVFIGRKEGKKMKDNEEQWVELMAILIWIMLLTIWHMIAQTF